MRYSTVPLIVSYSILHVTILLGIFFLRSDRYGCESQENRAGQMERRSLRSRRPHRLQGGRFLPDGRWPQNGRGDRLATSERASAREATGVRRRRSQHPWTGQFCHRRPDGLCSSAKSGPALDGEKHRWSTHSHANTVNVLLGIRVKYDVRRLVPADGHGRAIQPYSIRVRDGRRETDMPKHLFNQSTRCETLIPLRFTFWTRLVRVENVFLFTTRCSYSFFIFSRDVRPRDYSCPCCAFLFPEWH